MVCDGRDCSHQIGGSLGRTGGKSGHWRTVWGHEKLLPPTMYHSGFVAKDVT